MSRPVNRMRPVHPGEVLREDFLLPLEMSVNALAMALAVPATRIHEIVKDVAALPLTLLSDSRITLVVMPPRGWRFKRTMI